MSVSYDDYLLAKHQAEVDQADDQADDQEARILAKQAELIGNAITDYTAFIELQDELLYDDDLVSSLNTGIHQALQGKGNHKLFEVMEQAARIKAEQLVENESTVNKVTGLFTQMGLGDEPDLSFCNLTGLHRDIANMTVRDFKGSVS